MQRVFWVLLGVPAVAFLFVGLSWYAAPSFGAANFDMELLEDRGLGTQIADLGSFFITLGICMLAGLWTGNRVWLYPAMLLMGIASCGRVIAWAAHGAALTYDMIAVEMILVAIMLLAIQKTKA